MQLSSADLPAPFGPISAVISPRLAVKPIRLRTDKPPKFKRGEDTTMLVEQGKTVSQNILTDWIDPDGDDLFPGLDPG